MDIRIESWILKRTGEKHYLCRLCGGPNDDHGTEDEFQRHLSSWEHKINIKKMESLFCKVCTMRFPCKSKYNRHIESKSHKQKEDPTLKPNFKCEACNVKFLCKREEERHLATNKHAKNLSKTDL